MPDAWRFILGDLSGVPLANYSALATDTMLVPRLVRPPSLRMRVPSDHPDVAATHSDGEPKLARMCRTLRAFEPIGGGQWRIRFAGTVYTVQDIGEGDTAWTTITAFGPMQKLAARYTGVDGADRVAEGGLILRDLIDETNALGYTGIATTGYGNVYETTAERTQRYSRQPIGSIAVDLAGAFDGFDPVIEPVYQPPGSEDGTLGALSIYQRAGGNRPNAVFGWGVFPHNVKRIERTQDGTQLANHITGLGWTPDGASAPLTGVATDAASIAKYGRYEAVDQLGDITNQEYLDALLAEEAALRRDGRETVSIKPIVGDDKRVPPRPWHDFDLGDTVPVRAGEALRGGFMGLQRVYGFGVSIGNDGTTELEQILTSPDDAGS